MLIYKNTAPISDNKVWLVYFKEVLLLNQVGKYLYINRLPNRKVLDIF
jgi:hypothetical protein